MSLLLTNMDPNAMLMPRDTSLAVDGYSSSDLIDFEPSLTAAYTFPMTAEISMSSVGAGISSLELTNPLPVGEEYLDANVAGRYVSFDCQRSDSEFLPALSKTRSLTFDGKESAREVSYGPIMIQN